MVALNDPSTRIGQLHGDVNHLLRVAAITDQITQQSPTRHPLQLCMRHASVHGLQVGMNVREQCNFHNIIFQ